VRLEGCSLIGVTETWWDSSHNWNVAVVGYRLRTMARLGRQHAVHVRDQQQSVELYLGIGYGPAEMLWMRISIQTNEEDVVMGVCCRCLIKKK